MRTKTLIIVTESERPKTWGCSRPDIRQAGEPSQSIGEASLAAPPVDDVELDNQARAHAAAAQAGPAGDTLNVGRLVWGLVIVGVLLAHGVV